MTNDEIIKLLNNMLKAINQALAEKKLSDNDDRALRDVVFSVYRFSGNMPIRRSRRASAFSLIKNLNAGANDPQKIVAFKTEIESFLKVMPRNFLGLHDLLHQLQGPSGSPLPAEIMHLVFSFLNTKEKVKVGAVSHFFNELSKSDSLWQGELMSTYNLEKIDIDLLKEQGESNHDFFRRLKKQDSHSSYLLLKRGDHDAPVDYMNAHLKDLEKAECFASLDELNRKAAFYTIDRAPFIIMINLPHEKVVEYQKSKQISEIAKHIVEIDHAAVKYGEKFTRV